MDTFYPENFFKQIVVEGWESGRPLTYDMLTMELMEKFPQGTLQAAFPPNCTDDFYDTYFGPGPNALKLYRAWRKDVLTRIGFSKLKKTISQSVPNNWRELAIECVAKVRAEGIGWAQVVVNADQTFVNLHPEEDGVLAPTGTKRVGDSIKTDSKKGITVMVTAELVTGEVAIPFVVFDGSTCCCESVEAHNRNVRLPKGTKGRCSNNKLDRINGYYRARSTSGINFQHKHWFDGVITLRYLKWLKMQYPGVTASIIICHINTFSMTQLFAPTTMAGKRILLIWDEAPSHIDKRVREFVKQAREDGWLRVVMIPGGLTSILQVCDLVCNKDIKAAIKNWYMQWKVRELRKLGAGTGHRTLSMPRDTFIRALEGIFDLYNDGQRHTGTIKRGFLKVGMDIFNSDLSKFDNWMDTLATHSVYASLLLDHEESAQGVEVGSGLVAESDSDTESDTDTESEPSSDDDDSDDDGVDGTTDASAPNATIRPRFTSAAAAAAATATTRATATDSSDTDSEDSDL